MNLEILLAISGFPESNLDSSVSDQEVNINGYSILRNRNILRDRNRNGRNIFSNSIENVFFYLLISNVNPISIGTFYRQPNVNTFLETFFIDLKHIDLHKNDVYFLRYFNINLLLNDKFILKENQSLDFRNLSSP